MKQTYITAKTLLIAMGFSVFSLPSLGMEKEDKVLNPVKSLQMTCFSLLLQDAYAGKRDLHLSGLPAGLGEYSSISHTYIHNPDPKQDLFYPFALEVPEHSHLFIFKRDKDEIALKAEIGRDTKNILCFSSLPLGDARNALLSTVVSTFVDTFPDTKDWGWVQWGMIQKYTSFMKDLSKVKSIFDPTSINTDHLIGHPMGGLSSN